MVAVDVYAVILTILCPHALARGDKDLVSHLLENYGSPVSCPVLNSSEPVVINISVAIQNLIDLDDTEQHLIIKMKEYLLWVDEYLSWDPEEFSGVKEVMLSKELIWTPDYMPYERISDIASPEYMMSHILVQNDGTCTMGVTIVVQTFCQIDISRFPFDEQECTVNLGSAHYTADRMRVDKLSVVSKSPLHSVHHPKFRITNATMTYFEYKMPHPMLHGTDIIYSDVIVHIELARRPSYILFTLVFPAVVLSCVSAAGLLLPPGSEGKVSIHLSIILSFSVLILVLSDQLPPSSDIPSIGVLIAGLLLLNGISTLVSILTISIASISSRSPPCCVYKVANTLAWLLLLSHEEKKRRNSGDKAGYDTCPQQQPAVSDGGEEASLQSDNGKPGNGSMWRQAILDYIQEKRFEGQTNVKWQRVAAVTDRLMFIVAMGVIIISTTIFCSQQRE